ncbi:nuclear factor, interleukin 3 regulated, member 5 [Esox lucius]|uniref:BZIP domain-containing protein n=1 Tax=Esox lucius TaxID=8010 RepID=A0AAY5KHL4_ESOLU|nr:nuclear factor, interleukin 3 regulated, member 5 [Esox lucius]
MPDYQSGQKDATMESLNLHFASPNINNDHDIDTYSNYSESLPPPSPIPGDSEGPRRQSKGGSKNSTSSRRKREFISDEKKDASYWEKRRKNNEAAKRSREKRRMNDMVLENRVMALNDENCRLKTELLQLKLRFGLISTSAYMEKSQQLSSIGNANSGNSQSGSSNPYFSSSGYSSTCGNTLLNSDSSEAEQSARGERHTPLPKYSPRGSLSDECMSDDSSSPEPMGYEIKMESSNDMEMDNVGRTFDGGHQHRSQEADCAMDFHQNRQSSYHQEPVSLVPQQAVAPAQRSVIQMYRSPSSSYIESQRQKTKDMEHQQSQQSLQSPSESSETITEEVQRYRALEEQQRQQETKRSHYSSIGSQQSQDGDHKEGFAPELLHHSAYLSTLDEEEPPVLTYEGGSRAGEGYYQESHSSGKDTSSSDGDPRSSDKEGGSTSDDESPSSSSSEVGSYNQRVISQTSAPQSQCEDGQATYLPHKLRLKYRVLSNQGEAPNSSPASSTSASPSPSHPQHPYLALPSNQQHGGHGNGESKDADHVSEYCQHRDSRDREEASEESGQKGFSTGRKNKRRE